MDPHSTSLVPSFCRALLDLELLLATLGPEDQASCPQFLSALFDLELLLAALGPEDQARPQVLSGRSEREPLSAALGPEAGLPDLACPIAGAFSLGLSPGFDLRLCTASRAVGSRRGLPIALQAVQERLRQLRPSRASARLRQLWE